MAAPSQKPDLDRLRSKIDTPLLELPENLRKTLDHDFKQVIESMRNEQCPEQVCDQFNLPRFLLKNAVSEFDTGPGDPFASVGINIAKIKLIRVLVLEKKKENKQHIETAINEIRLTLERDRTTIVSVPV